MSEPGNIRHLSRRDLGKGVLAVAAGSALYFLGESAHDHLIEPIRKLNEDWDKAQALAKNPEALKQYVTNLPNVRLGCSFSPEQLNYLKINTTPQEFVKFLREDLGMQDVRLSIRSNEIPLNAKGEFDFKNYDNYIQEFIKQGFRICWNIDGFKVSRYPEHHFDPKIPPNIIPPPNTEVKLNDPLAKWILDYNKKLYAALDTKYGINARIKKGDSIQGINEPFTCAGERKLKASPSFLRANILALHEVFPEAKLIINSPGVPNSDFDQTTMQMVDKFIEQMIQEDLTLKDKLYSGFDWYGTTPNGQQPVGATRQLDMNAVVEMNAGSKYFEKRKQKKIPTQGTEIQCEPWGNKIRPGNYLNELIFALMRSLQVCDTSNPTQLNIWGIEYLFKPNMQNTSPEEQASIRNLIKQINKHHPIT